MNNIEILEEFINNHFIRDKLERDQRCGGLKIGEIYKMTELNPAIENLIQENKELKEKLEEKDMQHELELIGKEEYTKDAMGEIIEHYYTANEDCIPKSKVKEKIKELDKKMAEDEVDEFGIHSQGWAALDWTRDFLLELLGGE